TDSGIRLITAKVVKGGQIHDDPAEYIAADFYDEWMRRGLPQKLDVLLTTEAPLGEVAILRDDAPIALAQRIILLRAKPGLLDPLYLFYALQSDFGQCELRARASGTTVLGIKQSELRKVRIPVFPLPIQRRIAGILSAYDELIENSQRRIKILESMARALYREWFVHFRFPGHESVPRVPSQFGEIPKGWAYCELSELGFVGRGKSRHRPRNEPSLYGGPYPFFQTGDIKESRVFLLTHSQTYSEAGLSQSKLWEPGTLCITIAANIAETAILGKTSCFPDSVVGFVADPSKSDAFYVKLYLDSIKQQMQNVSRGTTQDNLSLEKLLGFRVLTPPSAILQSFREKVTPLLVLLKTLLQQEENLRRTRDLLLPRLLAGQIDVEAIAS
ncbi:MAG: restriction endonuclease subunit S, partial [Pirellula sp.]|nr:restriction endonuclease subunit S [Pirellula sp.]